MQETEGRVALERLLFVLDQFRLQHPKITASQIGTFVRVALNEGQASRYYSDVSRQPTQTVNRNILDLSSEPRRNGTEPGMGLIVARPLPTNRRQNEIVLSPDGRALVTRIVTKMQGKS